AERSRGNRDVLKRSEHVDELEVNPTNLFSLDLFQHGSHGHLLRFRRCTLSDCHILPAWTDCGSPSGVSDRFLDIYKLCVNQIVQMTEILIVDEPLFALSREGAATVRAA